MLRMPGFGLEGPWRDYVGWAMGLEQASGMAQVTGYPPKPMHPGGFLDPVIGMHAGVAVQAALRHRARTGEGQMIEVAQLEAAVCMTADQVIDYALNERIATRIGNRHPRVRAAGRLPLRRRPLRRAHRPQQPRMERACSTRWAGRSGTPTRSAARAAVASSTTTSTSTSPSGPQGRDVDEVVALLRSHGIPAGAVHHGVAHATPSRSSTRVTTTCPSTTRSRACGAIPGWPMQFSFGGPQQRTAPPTLGQHNAEILAELGLDDGEVEHLAKERVIGDRVIT